MKIWRIQTFLYMFSQSMGLRLSFRNIAPLWDYVVGVSDDCPTLSVVILEPQRPQQCELWAGPWGGGTGISEPCLQRWHSPSRSRASGGRRLQLPCCIQPLTQLWMWHFPFLSWFSSIFESLSAEAKQVCKIAHFNRRKKKKKKACKGKTELKFF